MEIIDSFEIILQYNVIVDVSSGEVKTECIKKAISRNEVKQKKTSTTSKAKKDVNTSSEPKLVLESNKYSLTQAAADLLNVQPDDKLDIKYSKIGKQIQPVIAVDSNSGNRLTKSLTVACRGSKHDELAKYGTEFFLVQHPEKVGVFILKTSLDEVTEEISGEDVIDELLNDIDLQDFIDDEDANVTEVSASMFNLNL